ncbi:hypothetical protein NE865_15737 [Phthorimaea operculella]|nr:hypothetical protein NE865_15737 [Phthorimaea operculella]
MLFSFLYCIIVVQCYFQSIYAKYNKDVVCVIDQDQFPVCSPVASPHRRNNENSNEPSYDPYIPRSKAVFYNCSQEACEPIRLITLTQITNPHLNLKSCFLHALPNKYECEPIRYNHLKNVDKLLFLRENIQDKVFYEVDCMIYTDKSRVCQAKIGPDAETGLADIAKLARPQEKSILSQDEFICEENEAKDIVCDLDPYIPFEQGLRLKQTVEINGDILLKTGSYVVMLKKTCDEAWCGYSGKVEVSKKSPSRRSGDWFKRYDPPGGKVFRCYYAKGQQVCKMLYDSYKSAYNERQMIRMK